MEDRLDKRKSHNVEHLTDQRLKDVSGFAKTVVSKWHLVSSVVLRKPSEAEQSIVLVFIIDDLNNIVLDQTVEEVRMSASEMAYTNTLPIKCKTLLASVFWQEFKARDDSALELARESLVIHDNGFFAPLQDLLVTGKVRPSKESVNIYFMKAERSMKTSSQKVSRAIIDLYWAVTDAAHAAVMVAGITPPSPKDLAETLKKELIARNLLHRRCGEIVDRIYSVAKKIMHREVFDISGKEFDLYLADADFFIKEIDDFVKEHAKER